MIGPLRLKEGDQCLTLFDQVLPAAII